MDRDQTLSQIVALHGEAFRSLQVARELMVVPATSMEAALATTGEAIRAQRDAIDALLAANRLAKDLIRL